MMILLTQEEYNDLLKKSSAVDMLVEEKLEQEKKRILDLLAQSFTEDKRWIIERNPQTYIRDKINEILR